MKHNTQLVLALLMVASFSFLAGRLSTTPTPEPKPKAAKPNEEKPKLTSPLDLNKASAAELRLIKGIGPAKAKAIVEHREAYGPFESIDQLRQVRGIGPKTIEAARPHLVVPSEPEEAAS